MKMSHMSSRRMLLGCTILLVLVAILLALSVIPAVKSDSSPGANPDRAVPAFWVNFGLILVAATACAVIVIVSKERSRASTSSLVVVGLVVLMLGLALVDAASAYRFHGPSMQSISTLLFICAAVDILVGITFGVVAFLRPKRV